MNAVKHGLYAESVVLSTESPEEYQETLDAYHQQFQPDGQAEFDLIEEMVAAKWRQRRLWAIESHLVELEMVDQKEQLDEEYTSYTEITQLASTYRALARSSTLPFLTRHESRLERAYSRALKNLLELQRIRKATQPAPTKNMQERTQSPIFPPPTTYLPPPAAEPPPQPTTHNPPPGEATGRAHELC